MNWKSFKTLNALIISFVLAGILIGILVVAQFQSSVAANSYLADELKAQQELLASFDADRVNLKYQIARLRQQIEENQTKLESVADQAKLESLELLKEKLGLTTLRGEGLRIKLSEGAESKAEGNSNLIHAADLRDLVNLLRTAKVSGISINGQRITPNATINALGSDILINKVKVTAPFQITVVGDTELIANRLSDQQAYPDLYQRIKKKSVGFEIEKLGLAILPIYDGDYLLKFAENAG
jgi:uncharacterized protein YlxW (UPF0749 family)